jgi:endo-1,3-1,4-beta-glycanase ExoK
METLPMIPWALGAISAALVAQCPTDSFRDPLQHVDPSIWIIADGWSNGSSFLSDWRRGQVRTDASGMTVVLDHNPIAVRGYSSGQIQSRQSYQFGYFEAEMTAAVGSGVDTGFYTYTGPSQHTAWNEVDVEILGRNTRAVQFTYHVGNQQRATTIPLPFDSAVESHSYGFDWQPRYINWYIDGKLAHTETGATLPLPDISQQVMFDVWNSDALSGWMGHFVWPGHPITAHVRCIARSDHFSGKRLCN